jgi:RHS repeat-associated protein
VETDAPFEKTGSDWFRVATTKNFLVNNSAAAVTETRRERLTNFAVNGTEKTVSDVTDIDWAGNSTRTTVAVDRAAKRVTETTDTPESSTNAVRVSVNGLLQSTTPTTPESATTYVYDALGRLTGTTSPRTGTTTRAYHATTGQLVSTADAAGSTGYEYFPATHASAGRLKTQTNAAGKKTYFNYSSRGELIQTWGDTTYPLEYVFDSYGQRTELHTFRSGNGWQLPTWPSGSTGTADVTRWIYHEPTGLQQQKRDAANQGANYSYDALGRLRTRTWARLGGGNPLVTTYSFDPNGGDLTQIDYSDSTPDAVFTSYDRAGRPTALSDAAGSHTLSYNVHGELQGDQVTGGILDAANVTVGYDSYLRRNSLQAARGAASLMNQTYGYDTSSRLETITGGLQTVTYGYDPTRGLLNTNGYSSGTTITRAYDGLGRLQSITTAPPASPAISYTYTYNNLHQRTRVTREDGSYWSYGYNDRGEVISGKKYWVDNSPVAGMHFDYGFDNLGNRNSAKSGGNTQGTGLREATYSANSLNQYTQRTVPGGVDIVGTANAAAVVTVNNQATERKGEYFHKALALDNAAAPVYSQVDVVGVKNAAGPGGEDAVVLKSGNVYLPRTPELFTHDLDGNLTSDGRWTYTWNAENRLIAMEAIATVPALAKLKLEFAYDFRGRRVRKLVYNWNGSTSSYQLQSTTKFVYDGWNLVAELDGNNNLIRSYLWGQDLSGTLQGAGGIGGLILIGEAGNSYLPGYDGSGNVIALTKVSTGALAASYEYSSFGEKLAETGEHAELNRFRFSTKHEDAESLLLDYGFRYFDPSHGRWASRDRIGDLAFLQQLGEEMVWEDVSGLERQSLHPTYLFVANDPVNHIDPFGLKEIAFSNQSSERKGDYFSKALALDNSTAPVHSQVDVVGVKNAAGPGGEDTVVLKSGNTYLPKTPELFTHDADGNLTSDGRWTYTWDAENRLIQMEPIASVPTAAKLKLQFAYDRQSWLTLWVAGEIRRRRSGLLFASEHRTFGEIPRGPGSGWLLLQAVRFRESRRPESKTQSCRSAEG